MQSSRKRKSRMETDKISKWGASQRRTGKLSGASSQARRHPTGSRPSPAGARPGSTPHLNQGDPPC